MITELEDVQDKHPDLIHDSDTMIAYLKRVRHLDKGARTFFMTKFQKETKNMRILSSFAKEVYLILDIHWLNDIAILT